MEGSKNTFAFYHLTTFSGQARYLASVICIVLNWLISIRNLSNVNVKLFRFIEFYFNK